MNDTTSALLAHKTWATVLLIEACARLEATVLENTVAGTFGTVHETLQHLVTADESYLALVSGLPREDSPPTLLPLDELAERTRRAGPRWEALARDEGAQAASVRTRDGYELPSALVMAQAVHHADDHRSHVLTILGALGIELPDIEIGEDLDVWHFALATGAMRAISA